MKRVFLSLMLVACASSDRDSTLNTSDWTSVEQELPIDGECDPTCGSCPESPVILDLDGNFFHFTDAAGGVMFDIDASGHPQQVAWTQASSQDAWLALDRNQNGLIDNGNELFGNYTVQPADVEGNPSPNGFLALSVFDSNHDGWVDSQDGVYSRLRLWVDASHDGVSQPDELFTLESKGVRALSTDYKQSAATDPNGNLLYYRAKVDSASGYAVGPYAYDVFLSSSGSGQALTALVSKNGIGTTQQATCNTVYTFYWCVAGTGMSPQVAYQNYQATNCLTLWGHLSGYVNHYWYMNYNFPQLQWRVGYDVSTSQSTAKQSARDAMWSEFFFTRSPYCMQVDNYDNPSSTYYLYTCLIYNENTVSYRQNSDFGFSPTVY